MSDKSSFSGTFGSTSSCVFPVFHSVHFNVKAKNETPSKPSHNIIGNYNIVNVKKEKIWIRKPRDADENPENIYKMTTAEDGHYILSILNERPQEIKYVDLEGVVVEIPVGVPFAFVQIWRPYVIGPGRHEEVHDYEFNN